ncbi:hypothetical protein SAMN05421505_120100 [Sinosporangium album]|uniref:Uncharacterized protein n=1 Tax=Sinosporangium album TaxID=504805 RepID=A0A1G8EH96_9ACTN|nr:hypothetical protein [Sinosporangium album]SDH69232.1 hypothetical protein SAMN05421505_120100 [Sinosporangium album]
MQDPHLLHIAPAPRLDGRQAARVGASNTAKEIADYAAGLVPTTDDRNALPGEFLDRAARLRVMAAELLHRAVTVELMRGTTWDTIAARLRLTVEAARRQFEHCDLTDMADTDGTHGVWAVLAETCVSPVPGSCGPDPGRVALQLDDWHTAYSTAQPDTAGAPPPRNPVTIGL